MATFKKTAQAGILGAAALALPFAASAEDKPKEPVQVAQAITPQEASLTDTFKGAPITVSYGDHYTRSSMTPIRVAVSDCELKFVSRPEFENGILIQSGETKKGAISTGSAARHARDLCTASINDPA